MSKMQRKNMISITGIILAIVFLLINPFSVAQISTPESEQPGPIEVDCVIVDEDGISAIPLLVSQDDLDNFIEKLEQLTEELGTQESYRGLLRFITEFTDNSDETSFLEMQLFEAIGDLHLNLIGKRVFILSHGRGYQINPLRKFQVNLLRPSFLFWYYPGSSTRLITTDRTIIVDPSPFQVRMLDGRQIGFMRRFIGVYLYIPGATSAENRIFFAGYAYRVFGLDLSFNR